MSRLSVAATDTSNAVDAPFDDARASRRLAGLLVEVARSVNRDLAPVLPSRLDGDPRLDALRSVLLEHDRAALAALQQKMDDPQQFAEAISAVLARAFALAETREELATVLAPRGARRPNGDPQRSQHPGRRHPPARRAGDSQVHRRDAGRDAAVALNQAFKHSLSWRGLKWRLEAYRSGSTFAEVVLKHTVVFRVEHLFLIHRKTGLLLEHVAASEAETQDPHMVSGMLTAIQDFVRDSFRENTSGDEARRAASTACGSAICCSGARRDHLPFWRPSSGATRRRRSARSCATRSPAYTTELARSARGIPRRHRAPGGPGHAAEGLPAATGAAAGEATLAVAVGAAAGAAGNRRFLAGAPEG